MNEATEMNPVIRGQKIDGNELARVMSDMSAAPDTLLKIIH